MKCPNPDCPFSQNDELKETCKFCFECGFNLRQHKKTTSAQNENTAPLSEDSKQVAAQCDDLHCNAKGSNDQADEQQEKKVEEVDDKPASEKSGEPSSGQSTLVADSTANPLETLALETKSGEQRKTELCGFSGGNISSDLDPQEAAGYNKQDIADQQQKKKVGETEDKIKAAKEKSGEPSSDQSTLLGSNANEQQQTENADGQQKRNLEKTEDKPATEKSGEPSSGQSTPLADSTEIPLENRALKMRSGEQQKTEQDQADEQQEKKLEEVDDKPASEESGEPSSGQSTLVADSTASPLENLALEMNSEEQQKTEQGTGGNISSNPDPQESAGFNSPGGTSKALKAVLVKEDNTKASSHEIESNQPDEKNISEDDKNKNGSEVHSNIEVLDSKDVDVANKVDSITSSRSKDSKIGSRSNQSEDALVPNNDNAEEEDEDEEETESDSEEEKPGLRKKLAFWGKSKAKRAREKKKKRKKRKEKKQQQAAQKERNNGSGVNNQGPLLRSNDGNVQKNQATSVHRQPENDRGDNNKDNNKRNAPNPEFFGEEKRKKMTVFFHAVLAPHFKFEADQGDRIFMRFGGPAFGNWKVNVVEVHSERPLENDYILVQAKLLVPFTLLSETVLYKYIVQKTNVTLPLWENIPGRGDYCNRCLQVPKERCKPEGDCCLV